MNPSRSHGTLFPPDIHNPKVYSAYFRQYYAPLCFFAERIVGDNSDAEDIVEEAFFKLWHRNNQFENEQHLKAFLYRSVKNACLDFLKLNVRRERRHSFFSEEQGLSEESYLNEIIRTEVIREIYEAIESLPPQCGKIIKMSFVDGKTNQEIADDLNLSMQTVKNQKGRGLALLKSMVSNDKFQLLLLLSYQPLVDLIHKN
jgi:RNA polymerase sigma-70 factor (family 1)